MSTTDVLILSAVEDEILPHHILHPICKVILLLAAVFSPLVFKADQVLLLMNLQALS